MGITYIGKTKLRDLLNGDNTSPIIAMMWGGGSPVINFIDSQTALGSEIFPSGGATSRNVFYEAIKKQYPFQNIYSEKLYAGQLVGASLFEVGLSDSTSGPNMIARKTRAKLVKTSGLEILADWYIGVDRV